MGGILGPLTPQLNAPDRKVVGLDEGTNNLIDTDVNRGQQSQDQFAQESLNGVSEGAQKAQQSPDQAAQEDARMGYAGNSMNQAIRNQYNAQAGSNIQRLKSAYQQNAVFQKSAALQQASAEAMARQNVATQSYGRLMDAYNTTETARAQILSSILGAGGQMVGTAAAGKGRSKAASPPGTTTAGEGFDASNIA